VAQIVRPARSVVNRAEALFHFTSEVHAFEVFAATQVRDPCIRDATLRCHVERAGAVNAGAGWPQPSTQLGLCRAAVWGRVST